MLDPIRDPQFGDRMTASNGQWRQCIGRVRGDVRYADGRTGEDRTIPLAEWIAWCLDNQAHLSK